MAYHQGAENRTSAISGLIISGLSGGVKRRYRLSSTHEGRRSLAGGQTGHADPGRLRAAGYSKDWACCINMSDKKSVFLYENKVD